jgi:hypothetical protein
MSEISVIGLGSMGLHSPKHCKAGQPKSPSGTEQLPTTVLVAKPVPRPFLGRILLASYPPHKGAH